MACIVLLVSTASFADYSGSHTVKRMYIGNDGWVFFGTSPQASETCDYYGLQFKFDSNTKAGKSMLALLLSAKVSQESIDVWYTPSTAAGTDAYSGCKTRTTAESTIIGFH